MVTRVRNVNPVQFGLVYGVIVAVLAFIFALLMLPFGALMASMGRAGMFGFGSIAMVILAPILYFCVGFVGGALTAIVYNFVAGWTGGVEVTLSTAVTSDVPHAPGYTG